MKMNKYSNYESYVLNELKMAHDRNKQLENQVDEVVRKLRAAECQIANLNDYIIELEEKSGIVGDV